MGAVIYWKMLENRSKWSMEGKNLVGTILMSLKDNT